MSPLAGRSMLDGPTRLAGIDLARGLAVLGMLAAHLLVLPPVDLWHPGTWIGLADGRSSILFAVLAGVSLALVSGGAAPRPAAQLRTTRRRIAVRAVILWVLGMFLIATGVPVYVILPAYAILFLLALPLLALPARALWLIAAGAALVMPWVQPLLDALPVWAGVAGHDLSLMVGWHYPFPVWIAFVAAGLAAARSDLRTVRTPILLAAGGLVAAVAAVALDAAVTPPAGGYLAEVWTDEAHSSGILEVIGSGGGALATIGLCVLLCRTALRWVVLPLRAVGAMPLTVYTLQLVVWAVLAAVLLGDAGDLTGFRALQPFWPFVITSLVACTVWAMTLGRGPLERLIDALTGLVVPRGEPVEPVSPRR